MRRLTSRILPFALAVAVAGCASPRSNFYTLNSAAKPVATGADYSLPPGKHPKYSNPWVYKIVKIDVRSQKLAMSGEQAVDFLSEDGFPIHTEGTIEYALDQKKLADMFVIFVDDKDIESSGGLRNIGNMNELAVHTDTVGTCRHAENEDGAQEGH